MVAALAASDLSSDMSESLSNWWTRLRTIARRRFGLRTLVLQALEFDAKDHDQSMDYPSGTVSASPDDLDALLPEGLGDLPGPLGVELWLPAAGAGSAESLVERLERSSAGLGRRRELAGLLFIHNAAIDDSDMQRVDDYLAGQEDAAPIHVWGPNEMTALFE